MWMFSLLIHLVPGQTINEYLIKLIRAGTFSNIFYLHFELFMVTFKEYKINNDLIMKGEKAKGSFLFN